MKVFVNAPISDLKDKPLAYPPNDPRSGQNMTFGSAAVDALVAFFADEQRNPQDGKEKYSRYKLATKIENAAENGGMAELSVDDLREIKTLVGKYYTPIVVGRVYDLIESAEVSQKDGKSDA